MSKTADHRRSIIWDHFKFITQRRAECLYCHKVIGKSGGTSNLCMHLKRKHSKVFNQLDFSTGNNKTIEIDSHPIFHYEKNLKDLIEFVKNHPVLYDGTQDQPENCVANMVHWEEIGEILVATDTDCLNCWNTLRIQYECYFRNSNRFDCRFPEQMSFLDEHILKKKIEKKEKQKLKLNPNPNKVLISLPGLLDRPIHEIKIDKNEFHIDENTYEDYEILYDDDIQKQLLDEQNPLEHKKIVEESPLPSSSLSPENQENSIDAMDEIDYFIEFLNKKLRKLPPNERRNLQFKFIQTICDSELRQKSINKSNVA